MNYIRRINLAKSRKKKWVINEHNKSFIKWFRSLIVDQLSTKSICVSENLRWLAHGPRMDVVSYRGYPSNGYCFYIKGHDDRCIVQNSGVTLVAQLMHISSAKDNKVIFANMSYYGVIENIWELDYIMFRVSVFQCKWVKNNKDIKVDELGFILVNLNKENQKEDTFILASQAK